jgi:hypothetical protein
MNLDLDIIENFDLKSSNEDLLLDNLNKINDIIRSSESARKNVPNSFYTELIGHFRDKTLADFNNDVDILLLKCLKNSAATFKEHLNKQEYHLANLLIDKLKLDNNPSLNDELNCLIFQYLNNFIQGNNDAFRALNEDLVSLSGVFLNNKLISFKFFETICCILLYISDKKTLSMRNYQLSNLRLHIHKHNNTNLNWSVKLVKHLCQYLSLEDLVDQISFDNKIYLTLVLGVINDYLVENSSQINLIQSKQELLINSCNLLAQNHSEANLKVELIRFIGNLVYENELNRNLFLKNNYLSLIIQNLVFDANNPFIREWSIATLKYLHVEDEIKFSY